MPNSLDITVVGQRRTNSALSFQGRFGGTPPGDTPGEVPDEGDPDYVPLSIGAQILTTRSISRRTPKPRSWLKNSNAWRSY